MPNYIASEKVDSLEFALVDVKEWQEVIFKFIKEEKRDGWISNKQLFDWRNLAIEDNKCQGIICCLVFDENNKLKGHVFAIKSCIQHGNSQYMVSWPVDYYISETLRGKGAGKKLLTYLDSKSPNLLLMGGHSLTYKIFSSLGWRIDRRIYKYNYVLNPINYFNKSNSRKFAKATNIIKSANYLKRSLNKSRYSYKELDHTPSDIESFVKQIEVPDTIIFLRPAGLMKWLIDDLPRFKSKYILMYEGDRLVGYSIIRLCTRENGLFEGNVIDICAKKMDSGLLHDLLRNTMSVFKKEGADVINIFTSHFRLKETLKKNRFVYLGEMNFGINKNLPSYLDDMNWHITMFESDYGYR